LVTQKASGAPKGAPQADLNTVPFKTRIRPYLIVARRC
jgi:hypothetical protein